MFGTNVKVCREFLGVSQIELAERTGIKQSALSRYEKNESSPSVETARVIAQGLGVSLDLIMLDEVNHKDLALSVVLKDFESHVRQSGLTLGKIEILQTVFKVIKNGIVSN